MGCWGLAHNVLCREYGGVPIGRVERVAANEGSIDPDPPNHFVCCTKSFDGDQPASLLSIHVHISEMRACMLRTTRMV